MSGSYWFIIAVYFIILQQISAQTVPQKGGNVTLDSDGCQIRKRFFKQETIPNLKQLTLFSFTINCTTQTLYKVGYSDGPLCRCGEYLVNQNGSHKNVFCRLLHLLQVNFTVEISVENVRSPGGERCTFSLNSIGGSTEFDVRILPQNVPTSVQPSPTSKVLPSSSTDDNDEIDEPPTGISDSCERKRRFFNKKTITNSKQNNLFGFSIICTTQAVYQIRFTTGQLCYCGEYFVREQQSTKVCKTQTKRLNFTVEISVEKIRNQLGENCSFTFLFLGEYGITSDLRILPGNLSTTLIPSLTMSEVLPSSTTVVEFPKGLQDKDNCTEHGPFSANKTVINLTKGSLLQSFTITCTTYMTFEFRNTKGKLCECGTVDRPYKESVRINCRNKLPLDIDVQISTKKVRAMGENCTIFFNFVFAEQLLRVRLFMKIWPGTVITKSLAVSQVVTTTRFFTSNITSSISLLSATSSLLVSQSELTTLPLARLRNSTMTSQISSTVMIPQPSQSVIPFFTGIIITPTPSILLSTSPSIQQSSVLATNTSTFIQATPTTSEVLPSNTLSPEMQKLKEDIKFINNVNTSEIRINDTKAIKNVLDAAANILNPNQTSEEQEKDPGMKAVEVLEDLGNVISQQLELGNESVVTFELAADDLVFGAAVINTMESPEFSFPSGKSSIDERIDIPSSVFASESGKSFFVGIIFQPYREMRNNAGNLTMGTKVINAIVTPLPSKRLKDPVEMTFEKTIINITSAPACSFYLENSSHTGQHGRWSTMGCEKLKENQTHIQCSCSHFTNFAVLFKISDDQEVSEEDKFRLVIITYIGLSLSILGCILTFIIYVSLSSIKSDRATIHTNLVLTLGIADVIFLVTVAVQPEGDSCLALAMLAFYFYLGVFFWMLNEGVYIYLMVIKVFRGNVTRRRRVAYLVGWGCPFIIAIITWAVLRDDVISEYHCWLSVKTGAIWAFVGPGLAIILFNMVILLAVMRTTWATFVDDKEYGGLKSATKTFGAVIPILGITWVFGVMAFNESSIVFQYIFAIANSIQGALIFILYCIVNNEVRNELLRKFEVWQTRREVSSSTGGGRRTTYPYIVSSEKNTTFNRTTALSAQATPDFNRVPLADIKDGKSSGRVEKRYSFDNINVTPGNDSELSVPKDDADREEVEDSGRSSPVKLGKEVGNNDVGDDSVGHV